MTGLGLVMSRAVSAIIVFASARDLAVQVIANGRSQANRDFICVSQLNCEFAQQKKKKEKNQTFAPY